MDRTEAARVLREEMTRYGRLPRVDLTRLLGEVDAYEVEGAGGVRYQVEVEAHWDGAPGETIRVLAGIDDGSLGAGPGPFSVLGGRAQHHKGIGAAPCGSRHPTSSRGGTARGRRSRCSTQGARRGRAPPPSSRPDLHDEGIVLRSYGGAGMAALLLGQREPPRDA